MYFNLVFRPSKCEQAYCRVSYRKEQHAQSMQTRLTDKNRWKCAADMAFALRKRTDGGNALRPINDNISSGSTPTRAPASCFQCCQLRRRRFSLYVHGPPVFAACYHWLCDVVVTEHREGTDDRDSKDRARADRGFVDYRNNIATFTKAYTTNRWYSLSLQLRNSYT